MPRVTQWDDADPMERAIGWAPALVLALALAPLTWMFGFALLGRSRFTVGALLIAASVAGFVLYYLVLSAVDWHPPSSGLI